MSGDSRAPGQPLWAPWRMEYIEGAHEARGCIFCEPATPVVDRERLILFRGRHVFVLLNRYPYAAGHLMVAPNAHVARLHELDTEARRCFVERDDGTARVEYRGTQWDAEMAAGEGTRAETMYIVGVRGSTLVIAAQRA